VLPDDVKNDPRKKREMMRTITQAALDIRKFMNTGAKVLDSSSSSSKHSS
jgi:hypothetical protein